MMTLFIISISVIIKINQWNAFPLMYCSDSCHFYLFVGLGTVILMYIGSICTSKLCLDKTITDCFPYMFQNFQWEVFAELWIQTITLICVYCVWMPMKSEPKTYRLKLYSVCAWQPTSTCRPDNSTSTETYCRAWAFRERDRDRDRERGGGGGQHIGKFYYLYCLFNSKMIVGVVISKLTTHEISTSLRI